MAEEWAENFWSFTEVVGVRPENCTLRRPSTKLKLGPYNWEWKEKTNSKNKAAYARDWRNKNPDKAKSSDLKKLYGIGLDEYNAMLKKQNGVCAICENTETAKSRDGGPRLMPVDHCHKTGKIRAILCHSCNTALGGFKDDPELLKKAISYLRKYGS